VLLTALSSCGDQAHPSAPTGQPGQAGQAIGGALERRTGPASHLLVADAMPTAGPGWSDTTTANEDYTVLGPCHLTSLVDIGALNAVRRTWRSGHAVPRAIQVVAKFADTKSAWRAHEVLGAWMDDCAGRVDGDVGPMRDVTVATGFGQAYRVGQGDKATDVGIVRKGAYLSVVTLLGRSAKLPEDSSVAKVAVKRIAATF
jgi:hypothetical protein